MTHAKYLEIAKIISQRINDGTYTSRLPLPDQETLAKEFGVSRLTVKKALDGLERQGLVYKQSGLGTFVSSNIPIKSSIDSPANMFMGLKKQLGSIMLKVKFYISLSNFLVNKSKKIST